jgi:hypothetical protein
MIASEIIKKLEKLYSLKYQDIEHCEKLQQELDKIRSKCKHTFENIGQETGSGRNLVECSKCLLIDYYKKWNGNE